MVGIEWGTYYEWAEIFRSQVMFNEPLCTTRLSMGFLMGAEHQS